MRVLDTDLDRFEPKVKENWIQFREGYFRFREGWIQI